MMRKIKEMIVAITLETSTTKAHTHHKNMSLFDDIETTLFTDIIAK